MLENVPAVLLNPESGLKRNRYMQLFLSIAPPSALHSTSALRKSAEKLLITPPWAKSLTETMRDSVRRRIGLTLKLWPDKRRWIVWVKNFTCINNPSSTELPHLTLGLDGGGNLFVLYFSCDKIKILTSVLPFLTSSRRSNIWVRLGSSDSTNHNGGVKG